MIAAVDLIHFAIVYFSLFFLFAASGHMILGRNYEVWATFGGSWFETFDTALGNAEFEDWKEESGYAELLVWYYGMSIFIVHIDVLLTNMMIAIIFDAYVAATKEASKSETLLEDMVYYRT